jgi:hypothetical protein
MDVYVLFSDNDLLGDGLDDGPLLGVGELGPACMKAPGF